MANPAANPDARTSSPQADNVDVRARRELIAALGIDLAGQPVRVRAAIEAMADEILALRVDRARLQEAVQAAELLADHDPLCPVFNRRAFERELAREIALAERHGAPLCLVYMDLDRFKLVNDRFGHATGDEVICRVAHTLLENVRQTDIVGRLGGDEFAIVLTHAELSDCEIKAASLEAAIDGLKVRDNSDTGIEPVQLGASCGVVEWRRGLTVEALIAAADEAMFRVKARRRSAR